MTSGKTDIEKGMASPTKRQNRKSTAGSGRYTPHGATPALRPRGRGGIFGGIVQQDANMTDARGERIVRAKRDKNMSARRGRTARG